jgi:hypothetical protein
MPMDNARDDKPSSVQAQFMAGHELIASQLGRHWVTVTSDQLGITVNFEAVIKLIRELIEFSRPAKNAHKSNKQK